MHTINISGTLYKVLTDAEANIRRAEFINNAEMIAGVDKLAALVGSKAAEAYFVKVLDNLKYEEIKK